MIYVSGFCWKKIGPITGIRFQPRDVQDRKGTRACWHILRQELAVEITGNPDRQNVDHRAADDLVGLDIDRNGGMQGRQRQRRQDGRHQGDDPGDIRRICNRTYSCQQRLVNKQVDSITYHGRHQHLAFDADIHHAGSLAHHAAERSKRDRGHPA